MKINEVTQKFGKQEPEPLTKRKKEQAVKAYKEVDKIANPPEFQTINISKGKKDVNGQPKNTSGKYTVIRN